MFIISNPDCTYMVNSFRPTKFLHCRGVVYNGQTSWNRVNLPFRVSVFGDSTEVHVYLFNHPIMLRHQFKFIYSGVSQNGTPKSGQPLHDGETSWNGMNLPYTYVIVKHSPRSRHLSTTDECLLPKVSVIRKLHCMYSFKSFLYYLKD